jgi:hypothetical protein
MKLVEKKSLFEYFTTTVLLQLHPCMISLGSNFTQNLLEGVQRGCDKAQTNVGLGFIPSRSIRH